MFPDRIVRYPHGDKDGGGDAQVRARQLGIPDPAQVGHQQVMLLRQCGH